MKKRITSFYFRFFSTKSRVWKFRLLSSFPIELIVSVNDYYFKFEVPKKKLQTKSFILHFWFTFICRITSYPLVPPLFNWKLATSIRNRKIFKYDFFQNKISTKNLHLTRLIFVYKITSCLIIISPDIFYKMLNIYIFKKILLFCFNYELKVLYIYTGKYISILYTIHYFSF